MSNNIVALIYLCISLVGGCVFASVVLPNHRSLILRIFASWAAVTSVLMLTPNAAIFCVASAVIVLMMSPKDDGDRLLFYFAMLLAVPDYAAWRIPFPGVNYLLDLKFPMLLNLVLLGPVLLSKGTVAQKPPGYRKANESTLSRPMNFLIIAIGYLAFTSILDFRLTSPTDGLRVTLGYFIAYGIPVIAVTRLARSPEAIEKALFGLMIAGIFALSIGVMQFIKAWTLYTDIPSDLVQYGEYAFIFSGRGNSLRVPGTMLAIPFGMYMALCASIAWYFATKTRSHRFSLFLAPIFVAGIVLSGSRGAILLLAVSVLSLVILSPRAQKFRLGLMVVGGAALILSLSFGSVISSFENADPYGTFTYRIELLRNSGESIALNPLFGTPDYLENPTASLERSRQGQGIIDIVNAYLQIILKYGIVGLSFFVFMIWRVGSRLAGVRRSLEKSADAQLERLARVLFAVFVGYAVAIATVSLIDRLPLYLWLLLALGSVVHVQPQERAKETEPKNVSRRNQLASGY